MKTPSMHPLLLAKNITKYFKNVVANDSVNLELYKGEIHALLGENGAGKSTLINILSGLYSKDSGEIFLNNKKLDILSPKHALTCGIGTVYQHFHLSFKHTVFENIILNHPELRFFINKKELKEKIVKLMEKLNLSVNLKAKVFDLPVSEQQKVEILKVLFHGACILILDEPTAVLSPVEKDNLFEMLRFLKKKKQSHAILIVTHKLDEVMEIADRVTVLRKGKNIATKLIDEVSKQNLAHLMIGEKIENISAVPAVTTGPVKLKVENFSVTDDRGVKVVNNLSFSIKGGEILAIGGVSNQGQTELSEALFGLREYSGKVSILGKEFSIMAPNVALKHGMVLIPQDRLKYGIAKKLNVFENLFVNKEFLPKTAGLLDYKAMREIFIIHKERYSIEGNIEAPAVNLSGGNIQKLILAREFSDYFTGKFPEVIIATYPMRGLDIASCQVVRKLLLEMKQKGSAILFITESLDDIIKISDRVAVMLNGKFNGMDLTANIDMDWLAQRMSYVCET